MKGFFRRLTLFLTPLCLALQITVGYYAVSVPSSYVVAEGSGLKLPGPLTAEAAAPAAAEDTDTYDATLKLLGVIPVKQVSVRQAGDMDVVLGGTVFGMKLYTDGVLVVGFTDVDADGGNCHPAEDAGIRVGDVIRRIDGTAVSTKKEVAALVERSEGRPMTVEIRRDGVTFPVRFAAALSKGECCYRAGLWVRDSSAGIGTMSFYLPSVGVFAGLGHPICDADTGETLPICGGEIVPARIYTVQKSVSGDAGALCGGFDGDACGSLTVNGAAGVYGVADALPDAGRVVTVSPRQEVEDGPARIVCTLDGGPPREYEVTIRRVRYAGEGPDMELEVTDPALLEQTGGIVQGMSGSPILQNGKLVGAVTHVLVNDPVRGYGIFAETMLETAWQVAECRRPAEAS